MLSSVLNSERAIDVNIAIMRAFVKLRELLASNEELNRKFTAVIRKLATHDKYFTVVFDELKKLNEPPTPSRKQIGFKTASWVAPTAFYAAHPHASPLPSGEGTHSVRERKC
jgi:hypothetical protein